MKFLRWPLFLVACCLTTASLRAQGTVATTTTITVAPTSAVYGQDVTLSATVDSSDRSRTLNASVDFGPTANSSLYGTALLPNFQPPQSTSPLTAPFFTPGTYTIYATFRGDTYYASSSSGPGTLTVTKAGTITAITSTPPNDLVDGAHTPSQQLFLLLVGRIQARVPFYQWTVPHFS